MWHVRVTTAVMETKKRFTLVLLWTYS